MVIITNILSFLWIIVKLVLVLSIITIIHEWGHFLAAKLLKIKVNEFSIGFGPTIFSFKKKETKYSFRWLLLGGYNALDDGVEGVEDASVFSNQPTWKKIVVLIMGSTFNMILAFICFLFIGLISNFPSTTIEEFTKSPLTNESMVEEAGLEVGDEIVKVNGKEVKLFSDIENIVQKDNKFQITFRRDGVEYETAVTDPIKKVAVVGIILEESEEGQNSIRYIQPGKYAMNAGLKAGDEIISVNGNKVKTSAEVIHEIYQLVNEPINIIASRDGKQIEFNIEKSETMDYFNVGFIPSVIKASPLKKLELALDYVGNMFGTIIDSYKMLITGEVSVNQMSGIVGVGEVVSKTAGILDFIVLLATISFSIGFINLVPIPPMDGGKILITIGEAVTRKKLSQEKEAAIFMVFFILLILLTLYVTWNDIVRIF